MLSSFGSVSSACCFHERNSIVIMLLECAIATEPMRCGMMEAHLGFLTSLLHFIQTIIMMIVSRFTSKTQLLKGSTLK